MLAIVVASPLFGAGICAAADSKSGEAQTNAAANRLQADSLGGEKAVHLFGSLQSDMLFPTGKQADGSHEDWRTNTYLNLQMQSRYVDMGARLEYLEHPLPGFEKDFKGWGVPNVYMNLKLKGVELTAGTFYEQFGSGFILRTYEERSLGIDNSLMGGRVAVDAVKGLRLKVLGGKQRRYWGHNNAFVSGADAEWSLMEMFSHRDKGYNQNNGVGDRRKGGARSVPAAVTVGFSWVNKYERTGKDRIMVDATHRLRLPASVNAWDARLNYQQGPLSVLAEYAGKTQDPSFDNGYIYRRGSVAMLSGSYSQRGASVLMQVKRSDNFSFRSRRNMSGTSSMLNHLPAFAQDHTYALAAEYPYATNPLGEWAYQSQVGYTFRRHTPLGGKYGTSVRFNFSHIHSIDRNPHALTVGQSNGASPAAEQTYYGAGSKGYGSAFWKWGNQTYYQDFNIQMDKRLNSRWKLTLMYMNQLYNQSAIEGKGETIHANIFVAEGLWKISRKVKLRAEAQYLITKQDEGDWAFALAELSLAPHWMFSVSDEYNCGQSHSHYWQSAVTYNINAHRLQIGWGRVKEGYNCSGGVCRYVPESKGFTLSYNYNF